MTLFKPLSNCANNEGFINFIANKTKNNYVNLGGFNDKEVIDCVHTFLCNNGIWNTTDHVIYTKKQSSYIPTAKYHDISFVLKFYNLMQPLKEIAKNEPLAACSAVIVDTIHDVPLKQPNLLVSEYLSTMNVYLLLTPEIYPIELVS